ncbi:uncharacterized protein LOC126426566 [Schistocerca serialis cubense]|uniref:uncharacterized protein LOC126426566 n=1 Tax=Schistocerca serialis cubense TaxID=2023355 RepID=UPI00214E795C|nr:uncharacterized protein LOC126426566 [Schistocerca serialis cubense]
MFARSILLVGLAKQIIPTEDENAVGTNETFPARVCAHGAAVIAGVCDLVVSVLLSFLNVDSSKNSVSFCSFRILSPTLGEWTFQEIIGTCINETLKNICIVWCVTYEVTENCTGCRICGPLHPSVTSTDWLLPEMQMRDFKAEHVSCINVDE